MTDDDDPNKTYTWAERQRAQSPPCPKCGGPSTQAWHEASGFGGGPMLYQRGLADCRNECWRG